MTTSRFRSIARRGTALAAVLSLVLAGASRASEVDTSVVDVDSPIGQVSLPAGGSGAIAIDLSVTGNQEGTATFKINRDWILAGGTFTGSNPETFTVAPRASRDPATVFSTTGTVTVAAGHASGGPHTLQVGAIGIDNDNVTKGKLAVGSASSYAVTVLAPADSTPPVLTPTVSGTHGADDWYTSDVAVSWAVTDPQSTALVDSGCTTATFTSDTTGVTSSCTAHSAGGSASESVTVKIDKTAPEGVTLSPSGTEGTNDWYTSAVTVATNGSDGTSGVTCTADQQLSDETAGQVVEGSCTNGAGLTAHAAALTIRIDETGPSADLAVTSGSPGANGWYTSNVTVAATGDDPVSGPVTCSPPVTLTTETEATTVSGWCANDAGLRTDATELSVRIDKTNPTAALALSGTLGSNGWYTSAVTVTTHGSDTVSTPVVCTADQAFAGNTTGQVANGSCTNGAGLTEHATPITLKIDTTPPTAALSVISGTAGLNGWYTSDVVVRATGSDPTSGVAECTADTTLDTETGGAEVTGSCTNGAGVTTQATPITVKVDKTAPSVSLDIAGTQGLNGWHVSDVTVTTNGREDLSNPLSCTTAQLLTTESTGITVDGSCTNEAGLTGNAPPATIKLDKTAPTDVVFAGGIADGSAFVFGSVPPAPTCTASGGTSLLDSCVVSGHSTILGPQVLTATARDNAGNETVETLAYTVNPWRLSGFYAPVDMDSVGGRVVNTVKNGSTVPLKFEVFAGSTERTETAAIVTPLRFNKINCTDGSAEAMVEVVASGGTVLRYDSTGGHFVYNWKTPTGAGSCYDVIVGTQDGSALLAHFRLK